MPGVAVAHAGWANLYAGDRDLIASVGKRAKIAGFDLVEFYPPADVGGALTALIGLAASHQRDRGDRPARLKAAKGGGIFVPPPPFIH